MWPRLLVILGVCAVLCLIAPSVFAVAPTLYAQANFQSPVRGDPDDLVMLGGYGFAKTDTVVYQAIGDAEQRQSPPTTVPDAPSATIGYAPVVSNDDAPFSLTIRLPEVMVARSTYAIWVRTALGEWSNATRINDPRPLWLSPAFVYSTARVAGLPRYLKLIGRNMHTGADRTVAVKLTGPQTLVLTALQSTPALSSYVVQIQLPSMVLPGRYHVAMARDGQGWVDLSGQSLEVRRDPPPLPEFAVADPQLGGCRPDDGGDVTACVVKAVNAAATVGGGTVVFGPGTWHLIDSKSQGVVGGDGIILPEGVNLRGAGPAHTRLIRSRPWNGAESTAAFSLRGDNIVSGFTFSDETLYSPVSPVDPFLHIGENSDRLWSQARGSPVVKNIFIFHNTFDHTETAISDGGLAIDGLFLTYNEFGAYRNQLELGGNYFNMASPFRVDDSVIANNTFKPGSFLDVSHQLGPIASEIGASHRMDFSGNTADGAAPGFLYFKDDARGWRAAFFFHMNNNHEMLLVSENVATCTGDKIGDGEAIALDNSGNTFAFDSMRPVVAADSAGVTVAGPLAARQHDRDLSPETYYVGHWVQVGDGPGMGQARKIMAYSIDGATGNVTFKVSPRWDVAPQPRTSRVSVGREFWQTLILANHVDHRSPLCLKGNRTRPVGGAIAVYAQTADSVVAGNEQYDTEGITFHENYNPPILQCPGCGGETFFQSFLDIRDNLIDGRYDSISDCSASGITGGVSAAPNGTVPPPTLGYGLGISHNHLVHAENTVGGAIAVVQGWYDGPSPHSFPILENLIIQHNRIDGITGPVTGFRCRPSRPRLGISFPGSNLTWKTVMYANSCEGVTLPLGPGGKDNVRVCSYPGRYSCECPPSGVAQSHTN